MRYWPIKQSVVSDGFVPLDFCTAQKVREAKRSNENISPEHQYRWKFVFGLWQNAFKGSVWSENNLTIIDWWRSRRKEEKKYEINEHMNKKWILFFQFRFQYDDAFNDFLVIVDMRTNVRRKERSRNTSPISFSLLLQSFDELFLRLSHPYSNGESSYSGLGRNAQ